MGKDSPEVDLQKKLPKTQVYFDESGLKVRTLKFRKMKKLGGLILPSELEMKPELPSKRGHLTIIRYESLEAVDLRERVFSRRNLRRKQ